MTHWSEAAPTKQNKFTAVTARPVSARGNTVRTCTMSRI